MSSNIHCLNWASDSSGGSQFHVELLWKPGIEIFIPWEVLLLWIPDNMLLWREGRPVFTRDGAQEPKVGWSNQSLVIPKPRAWQVSLPATIAICVCSDKGGPIEIPVTNQVLKGVRPSSIYLPPYFSPRNTTSFHFSISRYLWRPSKMSKIEGRADVMEWPQCAH